MKIKDAIIFTVLSILFLFTLTLLSSCKLEEPNAELTSTASSRGQRVGQGANQVVQVWETTPNKTKLLQKQLDVSFSSDGGDYPTTITVDETNVSQGIDGFGYTLSGGSAMLINQMAAADQDRLLDELYKPGTDQLGVSYLRISIGASDLSSSRYTYDEVPSGQTDMSLAKFNFNQPETIALINIIKKILQRNPTIKILATPWTAPIWMKENVWRYDGYGGGHLNPAYYDVYASYFVKYIQAMKNQGITIDAITPQNEPLNYDNDPSMYMSANEQINFIKNNLGPKFFDNGITTKIICFDHNADTIGSQYAISVINDLGASKYVDGSAFHLYGGDINNMSIVHNANPNKNVYFTEQYVGGASNFGNDLNWHINNVIIGSIRNWSRNALNWNLAANPSLEPHTPGGCVDCLGAITISGNSYIRNTPYYIIGHASKFVRPGAVRIASNISGTINNVAFRNEDGSKVLLVVNNGSTSQTIKVKWEGRAFYYAIAAGSVITFKWTDAPIGKTITLKGFNNKYVSGENGDKDPVTQEYKPMTCYRTVAQGWESFTIVDAGDGKVALRSMGKYVSSENGSKRITCNRATIGDWEKFTWITNYDGTISLKGNNGKYISYENSELSPMTCINSTISGWEAFKVNQ